MLASSLAFIDGSVTNVALPAIRKDFGGGAADLPWVINAYLLPLSALLLLGGATGDHFGRRRMLITGITVFTLASIGCALAPDLAVLFASRAFQGVGAAILMPNSLGILGSSFEGEARGRAVGTWAAAGAIASAVGPPLGGWLVDTVGWRAIFYLNVPVALAAVVVAWRYVEESDEGDDALDWVGALLATAALGVLTWAVTLWSSHHAASGATWAGLAIGTILLLLFILTEHRLGEHAMMPVTLFASRQFVGLTLLTLMLYGALGGLLVLLPYLLIVGGGLQPDACRLRVAPVLDRDRRRLAHGRPVNREGRSAVAAHHRPDRHRCRVRPDDARRSACELLDQCFARDCRDRHWHGWSGRTVDDRCPFLRGRPAHRNRLRIQQRRRPHRQLDRHRGRRCRHCHLRRRTRCRVPRRRSRRSRPRRRGWRNRLFHSRRLVRAIGPRLSTAIARRHKRRRSAAASPFIFRRTISTCAAGQSHWRTQRTSLHFLRLLVKSVDGKKSISDQGVRASSDSRVSELILRDLRWRELDVEHMNETSSDRGAAMWSAPPNLVKAAEIG